MISSIVTMDPNKLDAEEIFRHLPSNRVGETDRRYMNEVLDDGFSNTKDPARIVQRLETAFAKKLGVGYALTNNSGTGTMHAALLAAGIGAGDEVIVPPLTAAATAYVATACGAVPVFADCCHDTFCIDPADIERNITEFTRAIIPVSIYGLSPDYDAILPLARKHNLLVVEDNAQCILGYYKGKLVGTFGNAASWSFQGSKHMTSGGDGGMVTTDDGAYALEIRRASAGGFGAVSARAGENVVARDLRQDWAFERHTRFGYNFRMSAMQAALALAQLERLDYLVAARRYIAAQYEKVIREEKCEWLTTPVVPEGCTHTYWTYVCKLNEKLLGQDWRQFRKSFLAHGGDGLYSAWRPLHLEPIYRTMSFTCSRERTPNFDPRYKGKVKSYNVGDCPVLEEMQPRLCQFKTSMQSLDKVRAQVDALQATLRSYA